MRARLLVLLMLGAVGGAEILDRVAVIVGKRAITQSDILKEIRLSAFMNRAEPDFGVAGRKKTAERLVERALAENEMEIGQYPAPEAAAVDSQLAALKKEQFGNDPAFTKALSVYGITETDLRAYLTQQVAMLSFIDARFGPGVQVLEEDISSYYTGTFRKEWENSSRKPLPDFDEVHAQIEETLRARNVNRLLDQWLKETRERMRIEFRSEAFQ